ncbi:response regulator transcription factor [bacterium]|nr:response regulator transcription factor [bacterium]
MRLLLIEDEKRLVAFLRKGLREESYAVDVATNGKEGLELARAGHYDLVILDISLPLLDGLEVCRTLRLEGNLTPILMLTARDRVEDRVKGLDTGADDYLVKPFSFDELLARIRALLRRGVAATDEISCGPIRLNLKTRRASRDGRAVELTTREFSLLEFLFRHPDEVISRSRIADHVWDFPYDSESNVIDVFVNRLRSKLDPDHHYLTTVRGEGYRLCDRSQASGNHG